jgi:hypothetical protein
LWGAPNLQSVAAAATLKFECQDVSKLKILSMYRVVNIYVQSTLIERGGPLPLTWGCNAGVTATFAVSWGTGVISCRFSFMSNCDRQERTLV